MVLGLRVWHCCSCGVGRSCGLDLIPGPEELPCAMGVAKKKKKKKNPQRERGNLVNASSLFLKNKTLLIVVFY